VKAGSLRDALAPVPPARGRIAETASPPIKAQFDATKGHRRLKSWAPSNRHLNDLLANGGEALVKRARDLVRNNAYARSACDAFAANLIGCGIKPSSLVTDPALKAEIQAAWLDWTDTCDADGLTDFYGLQALAARALFEAGECFIRLRYRRDGSLQLQMLEAEMCPWEKNELLASGTMIRCGIELNPLGKRVAYWFHRRHPGDSTDLRIPAELWTRVPADEIIHLYNPLRPGQLRGVPYVAPSMVALKVLGDYNDAELERKRIAALFAGFITKPSPDDAPLGEEDQDDGTALAPLEPGAMQVLLPGEDVKFAEPADVGGNFEAFQYRALLEACAGMGMPYATVTGDMRQVNYSSMRGGLLEFRRRAEQLQHAVFVFQMCRRVWNAWMESAVLRGDLALPSAYGLTPQLYRRAKWITPAWPWVDPLKDRQAEQLAVQMNWKARSDVIEAEGYDPEEVDQRIAQDQERAEALGIAPAMPLPGAGQPAAADEEKEAA
jgi:lambda family phage portal protein